MTQEGDNDFGGSRLIPETPRPKGPREGQKPNFGGKKEMEFPSERACTMLCVKKRKKCTGKERIPG